MNWILCELVTRKWWRWWWRRRRRRRRRKRSPRSHFQLSLSLSFSNLMPSQSWTVSLSRFPLHVCAYVFTCERMLYASVWFSEMFHWREEWKNVFLHTHKMIVFSSPLNCRTEIPCQIQCNNLKQKCVCQCRVAENISMLSKRNSINFSLPPDYCIHFDLFSQKQPTFICGEKLSFIFFASSSFPFLFRFNRFAKTYTRTHTIEPTNTQPNVYTGISKTLYNLLLCTHTHASIRTHTCAPITHTQAKQTSKIHLMDFCRHI